MPNINEINSAVYTLLANDSTLSGLCTIYKGAKRPTNSSNPAVTIAVKRLEPGDGEGMWMCDIVVNAYSDIHANGMPDHEKLSELSNCIREVLADTEIGLEGAKALPLIEGESKGPEWEGVHDAEAMQETTFGLVFVKF